MNEDSPTAAESGTSGPHSPDAPDEEQRYQPTASMRTILLWVIVSALVLGGSLIGLGYLVQ